jgi:GxxExxY protein
VPIECAIPIQPLDQDLFHALDKTVMKHVFAVHNEMGRFFDEDIYQAELARRCAQEGLSVQREVMITATHKGFRKDFFLDALIENGAIYELKCVSALTGGNESQLINYLLLAGIQHGKLINFRPPSVESRFVSTGLTNEKRRAVCVDRSGWGFQDDLAERVEMLILSLLEYWGAFLSVDFYREAVIHFLGGEDGVMKPVDVESDGRIIGTKKVCSLNGKTAVHLSAMTARMDGYGAHLRRFLTHTSLDSIHWINFNQDQIVFRTILKK